MSGDTMLLFAAASLFLVILPGPLADLTARYALSRGFLTGFLTVPATALGLVAAMTVASVPVTLAARFLPHLFELLTWVGLTYLMLHVLWTIQHPARGFLAHNDNLPERHPVRIFLYLFRQAALRPRSVLAFLALLPQAFDIDATLPVQLVEMDCIFFVSALAGGLLNVALARHRVQRLEQLRTRNPASRKPPTRFISRPCGHSRIPEDRSLKFPHLPRS